MQQNDLMDVLMLEKKINNSLNEVEDLTRQLAEAVDRQDQVSVRMLLSMRQEPIDVIEEAKSRLMERLVALRSEEASRLRELLQGKPAVETGERPLASQVAANQRLLGRIVELDRHINQRLGGKASFYQGNTGE